MGLKLIRFFAVIPLLQNCLYHASAHDSGTDDGGYNFGLRTADPESPFNSQILQTDSRGLFAVSRDTNTSFTPWGFNLTTAGTTGGYEFTNETYEAIMLGRKIYMWDPEPASISLVLVDRQHAHTGYPGTPWPSVYTFAKAEFNLTEYTDSSGSKSKFLEHGLNHGDWWALSDDAEPWKWRVLCWNGTQTAGLDRDRIKLQGIEILPVRTL